MFHAHITYVLIEAAVSIKITCRHDHLFIDYGFGAMNSIRAMCNWRVMTFQAALASAFFLTAGVAFGGLSSPEFTDRSIDSVVFIPDISKLGISGRTYHSGPSNQFRAQESSLRGALLSVKVNDEHTFKIYVSEQAIFFNGTLHKFAFIDLLDLFGGLPRPSRIEIQCLNCPNTQSYFANHKDRLKLQVTQLDIDQSLEKSERYKEARAPSSKAPNLYGDPSPPRLILNDSNDSLRSRSRTVGQEINEAKERCNDLGFKVNSEKFGDCVLRLTR